MENSREIILKTVGIRKTYITGDTVQHILNGIDIEIYKNDFTIIMGASGSGKSTLLNVLSGMDVPTSGQVYFKSELISEYNSDKLALFRRNHCGFVFQQKALIESMTVMDNVIVAGLLVNPNKREVIEKANALFDAVDVLPHTRKKYPSQISGGRAQRVAIVRALINSPEILFADEPTGALNSKTGKEVLDTMNRFNSTGQSIIMVTHDIRTAMRGNRILYFKDGDFIGDLNLPRYTGDDLERQIKIEEFLKKMEW